MIPGLLQSFPVYPDENSAGESVVDNLSCLNRPRKQTCNSQCRGSSGNSFTFVSVMLGTLFAAPSPGPETAASCRSQKAVAASVFRTHDNRYDRHGQTGRITAFGRFVRIANGSESSCGSKTGRLWQTLMIFPKKPPSNRPSRQQASDPRQPLPPKPAGSFTPSSLALVNT